MNEEELQTWWSTWTIELSNILLEVRLNPDADYTVFDQKMKDLFEEQAQVYIEAGFCEYNGYILVEDAQTQQSFFDSALDTLQHEWTVIQHSMIIVSVVCVLMCIYLGGKWIVRSIAKLFKHDSSDRSGKEGG